MLKRKTESLAKDTWCRRNFSWCENRFFCDYCCSKLLVLPNLGGLVFSEALVHGVPVLTGPADGSELDLLLHQSDFIMATNLSSDPEGWERMICDILNNPFERSLARKKGIKFAEKLTLHNYAATIYGLCKKIVGVPQ